MEPRAIQASDGLLIVDVQYDFLPGGALAVPGGDGVVPPLNAWIARFRAAQAQPRVYASRDWHPPDSRHFRPAGPWPPHCVQETPGAAFASDLALPPAAIVISKGTRADEDGYSAFDGRDAAGMPFAERLRQGGVARLWVGGLATDYCVRASVLAARQRGWQVMLLGDAIRAVDAHAGDGERALAELRQAGVQVVTEERTGGRLFW